jgi:hypothetical protein
MIRSSASVYLQNDLNLRTVQKQNMLTSLNRPPGEWTNVPGYDLDFRNIFEFPDLCRTEKSDPNGLENKISPPPPPPKKRSSQQFFFPDVLQYRSLAQRMHEQASMHWISRLVLFVTYPVLGPANTAYRDHPRDPRGSSSRRSC